MTVNEMRKAIRNKCMMISDCYTQKCPLLRDGKYLCFEKDATDEEIKRNYELMFGKEESEMKNEFDFNELKAGMAIKVKQYEDELLIGISIEDDIMFYSKDFSPIVSKKNILEDGVLDKYMPIEIYDISKNGNLFDVSKRKLLYKKEDPNFKKYKIGDLEIAPNYEKGASEGKIKGYKTEKEDFLFIGSANQDEFITINKSELDGLINTLTEIRDFIKGEE